MQLKSNALRGAGVSISSCSATALRMTQAGWDPHVALPTKLLGQWVRQMIRRPDHLAQVSAIWAAAVHSVAGAGDRIWTAVKGPITAVIATIMDFGGHHMLPLEWLNEDCVRWVMKGSDISGLKFEIRSRLEELLWKKASKHHLGEGLQHG